MWISMTSKPAAMSRLAAATWSSTIFGSSSVLKSSTFCLHPLFASFRCCMICTPIFTSLFASRIAATSFVRPGTYSSLEILRLYGLFEEMMTAASTTMPPTPPFASLI